MSESCEKQAKGGCYATASCDVAHVVRAEGRGEGGDHQSSPES